MHAYHFLPAAYALDDIAKQRIEISQIDQTNVPPRISWTLNCVSQEGFLTVWVAERVLELARRESCP
jgi:hypothetical protein